MDRSILDSDLATNRNAQTSESNSTASNRQDHRHVLSKQFSNAQLKDLCAPVFSQTQSGSVVECMKLKTWDTISPRDQILDPLQHEQIHSKPPFTVNYQINKKLALWIGDITNLDCQAIVHSTNETFKEDTLTTRKIYAKAGYEMYNHLKTNVVSCKTGDVQVTSAFGLPYCRFVFHTVGPKYKEKFHTAAEGALFNCYFKVLNAMREHKVTTLALCPLNTVRRGYPLQDAAHIGLRTLRRFLEKHLDEVERIVFVVDDLEVGIYSQILPLYFPRCENEEVYACYKLPEDIGGINGEPLLPERQIRVVDQPVKYSRHLSEVNYKDHFRYKNENNDEEDFDRSIDLVSGLESSVIVGKTSFAKMKNDVDKKWLMDNGMHKNLPARNPNRFNNQTSISPNLAENSERYELNRRMRYNSLLRRAKAADHTDLIKLRWMYVNGVDRLGRSVIVIIGSHFPNNLISLERALLYFIYQMDRIKDREYTLVYFHSGVTENNFIPLNFLRYVYDTIDDVYIRNLNAIYIVHPSLWFKISSWWFTTFNANGLKNKVISIKSLLDLDTVLELQHLKIPQSILNVDFAKNGTRYVADDANEFFY